MLLFNSIRSFRAFCRFLLLFLLDLLDWLFFILKVLVQVVLILHHVALVAALSINHLDLMVLLVNFLDNRLIVLFLNHFLLLLRQNLVHHKRFLIIVILLFSLINYLDLLLIQHDLIWAVSISSLSVVALFKALKKVFSWRMGRVEDWLRAAMLAASSFAWTFPCWWTFLSTFLCH